MKSVLPAQKAQTLRTGAYLGLVPLVGLGLVDSCLTTGYFLISILYAKRGYLPVPVHPFLDLLVYLPVNQLQPLVFPGNLPVLQLSHS